MDSTCQNENPFNTSQNILEKWILNFSRSAPFHMKTRVCIYFFKVNNAKARTMCEICLKLTIKTPKSGH